MTDTEKNMEDYRKLEELSKAVRRKGSEISEGDQKLIGDLRGLIDQVDKVRRGLTGKTFSPKAHGCVCEGESLCAHHAAVWHQLEAAADDLALAIRAAQAED